jgi:Holliday junction DNA helicase RuvB
VHFGQRNGRQPQDCFGAGRGARGGSRGLSHQPATARLAFLDEIHRLSRTVEEILYPAMEDQQLDIMVGKGPTARFIRLSLPPFTLVGATTRMGQVSAPLRDRFRGGASDGVLYARRIGRIVERSAKVLGISVTVDGCLEIARRSRGTPRIANRLLKRVRDYAQVRAQGVVDREISDVALKMLEVDSLGLDRMDRRILGAIIEKYDGGPVGLETLAMSVGEVPETLEDVYEPYLVQVGFLQRTPSGRKAMPSAYSHLGLTPPSNGDGAARGAFSLKTSSSDTVGE